MALNHFNAIPNLVLKIVVPQFKIFGRKKRKERKKIRVRDVSEVQ